MSFSLMLALPPSPGSKSYVDVCPWIYRLIGRNWPLEDVAEADWSYCMIKRETVNQEGERKVFTGLSKNVAEGKWN
jgi:hypothetical protein